MYFFSPQNVYCCQKTIEMNLWFVAESEAEPEPNFSRKPRWVERRSAEIYVKTCITQRSRTYCKCDLCCFTSPVFLGSPSLPLSLENCILIKIKDTRTDSHLLFHTPTHKQAELSFCFQFSKSPSALSRAEASLWGLSKVCEGDVQVWLWDQFHTCPIITAK